MSIYCKVVEQYFTVYYFNCSQFVILENLSVLDLTLPGVKGLNDSNLYLTAMLFIISLQSPVCSCCVWV